MKSEIHDVFCDAHQLDPKIKIKIMRMDNYWPSMIKDCIDHATNIKYMMISSTNHQFCCAQQSHLGHLNIGEHT